MRTALQLLGGVAVAGAVAAGSTAFTAAGFTNSVSGATFIGGVQHQSVTGADLVTFAATTTADPSQSQITQFLLTFASTTPVGRTVTLTTDGTSGGGSPSGFYCQTTQADFTSICKAGTSYAAPTGYYKLMTDVTITVS